jgi:hypothetical protein
MSLCNVLPIPVLPEILQFLHRLRHPERIFIQEFKAGEEELWGRGTGRAFPNLVAEAEGRCQREESGYGEERSAFLESLGENAAVPPRDGCVGGAENLGCGNESVRDVGLAGEFRRVLT